MSQCPATAYLHAGGVNVGILRCDLEEHGPNEHMVTLTWEDDDAIDWPEAHDPDEGFDVEVDALPHDAVVDARIAARSIGDDLAVERSHEAVETTARSRLDELLADHRESIRRQADAASAAKTAELQRRYGSGPGRHGA